MKKLIDSKIRLPLRIGIVLTIIIISYNCSKNSMDITNPGGDNEDPGKDAVWIQGTAFHPEFITIPVGTTITWTNKDASNQTSITVPNLFSSGEIPTNKTFSYKFMTPGTYYYSNSIQPSMSAAVIVKDSTSGSEYWDYK